jgi:hypothetical protein
MLRFALSIVIFHFIAAFAAPAANAWGPHGHEIVAEIAARQLDPKARAEVERLLHDRAPNAMREVSGWADSLQQWPGYGSAKPLHYVNFPHGASNYDRRRDCRNDACVVEALPHFVAVLRNGRNERERADALRWVIHLVADIHQPMHASYASDHGGNDVQLQFQRRNTNLHQLWDSRLLDARNARPVPYAEQLLALPRPSGDLSWNEGAAERWALESNALMKSDAYPRGNRIDGEYVRRAQEIIDQRLLLAGLRLGMLLNATLSTAGARSPG